MRFITEDTNKGDVKDPLSLNLYTYCQGNPITYYDYTGNNRGNDPMGLSIIGNNLPAGSGEVVLALINWLLNEGETVANAVKLSNYLATYYYPTMTNSVFNGAQTGLRYIDVSKSSVMTDLYNINPNKWHKIDETYSSFIKDLKKQKFKFESLPSNDMLKKAAIDKSGNYIYELHELQPIYNPDGSLSGMYYPIHYHLYNSNGKVDEGSLHYYFQPV